MLATPAEKYKNHPAMPEANSHQWKHPSVTLFAAGGDPVAQILRRASEATLQAMQEGWHGPPFDPFTLAEFHRIEVVPNNEVLDARTVPLRNGRVQIQYNPGRPRARIRYSVAHEIAHTLFRDCGAEVRNRAARKDYQADDWELEMLCNIGAAELLMPTGSLSEIKDAPNSIQDILELRKRFEVSTESVLLRFIRVTQEPCTMFLASRGQSSDARYRIDYSIPSRASLNRPARNVALPKQTVVSACNAVGYTSIGDEEWPGIGKVHVECVGISPYPGTVYPRVIGLVRPPNSGHASGVSIRFVTGDATNPQSAGARILTHVVNDATPNWGAGFGRVVQQKWPNVQQAFRQSWHDLPSSRLGRVFFSEVASELTICQMVCQHGYGPSDRPRLRYAALRDCLLALRDHAKTNNASVHMPRIGTGEAGGAWSLVSALIDETLCAAGIPVTVYDLPKSRKPVVAQRYLFQ